MVCRAKASPKEYLWCAGCDHCGDNPVLLSGDVGTDAGFPAHCHADAKSNCNSMAYGHQHAVSLSNPDRDSVSHTNTGAISYSDCYSDTNSDHDCDGDRGVDPYCDRD